ncbi:ABC transporter substrate-binding protein [Paenibacillus sp. 1P07SE]|uniref:ABC transporter substrate-binding protein n=1 Tax=Paenibacillus sp. 1P07SE TaxID=3132209 RepID=UPI0039A62F46
MKTTKAKLAVRAVLVLLCVMIAGSAWMFRDDLNELLFGNPVPTIAAVIEEDHLAEEGELALRVQASQYNNFMTTFGKPFIIRHPSVRIELVTEPSQIQTLEEFRLWVEQEQPDIYSIPLPYYAALAAEGELQPLDAWIKRDGLDMEAFHEPVIRLLRETGGGQIYGLTPEFAANGIYINKALFEQHGVPLPTDGMTWEELLHTAARFNGTGVTGLRLQAAPIMLTDISAGRTGFRR